MTPRNRQNLSLLPNSGSLLMSTNTYLGTNRSTCPSRSKSPQEAPVLNPPTCTPAFSVTSSNLQLPKVREEGVAAIALNIDVVPTVIVEVGHGNAHSPSLARQACFFGDL